MTRPAVLALTLLFACAEDAESVRAKLVEHRAERGEAVDLLYAEYGGGSVAARVSEALDEVDADRGIVAEVLRGAVEESDRAVFEADLALLGRGERVHALTAKARAFFARKDVGERARDLARLDAEIERLERTLAALVQPPRP